MITPLCNTSGDVVLLLEWTYDHCPHEWHGEHVRDLELERGIDHVLVVGLGGGEDVEEYTEH